MASPASTFSVDKLIELAEEAFDSFHPGVAAKYYEQAIAKRPDDALLHHKLAMMYVEHGDAENAHKSFLKSIELSPEENEANYLYIGQQCYGEPAKLAFEKGIALMQNRITILEKSSSSKADDETLKMQEIDHLKYEISSAYVSIAELFMTDLCEEEDAESQCEKYLNLSLAANPDNIETYAAFGQFRHCQNNDEDAIMYFALSIKKLFGALCPEMKPAAETAANSTNSKAEEDLENDDDDLKCFLESDDEADERMEKRLDILSERSLTIDSFLKIVKLGIELEQYEMCVRVLVGMLKADDGVGESWALGALVYYKLGRKKDCAIWLSNAESILQTDLESGSNDALQQTLEKVKSDMNMNELPDLSQLKLDPDYVGEDEEDCTKAFMVGGDSSDDEGGGDFDFLQSVMDKMEQSDNEQNIHASDENQEMVDID